MSDLTKKIIVFVITVVLLAMSFIGPVFGTGSTIIDEDIAEYPDK